MSKISIILTSYNHDKFLNECIKSVLAQTFTNFELMIWDDASTDSSWEIINSYKDSRIKAFKNTETKGAVYAINKAIQDIAQGKYIAIHHSDDIWEINKLEQQNKYLDDHPEIGAVFSRATIIGESGHLFQDKNHKYYTIFEQGNKDRFQWLNHFFKQGNALCHPSLLIRRECYELCGPYRNGLSLLPDLDMWVRLCLKYEIHILPEKLVRFRVRDGNKNSSNSGIDMQVRKPFEYLQVLENYRAIQSPDELVQIFPEAKQYIKPEGFDLHFALGMIALDARPDKFAKLFGLTLLFEAVSNTERAKRIYKLYNFSPNDFIRLATEQDVFSIKSNFAHSTPSANQKKEYAGELSQQLQQKERELDEIYNSRSWQFMLRARKVALWFLSPGDFLKKIFQFIANRRNK